MEELREDNPAPLGELFLRHGGLVSAALRCTIPHLSPADMEDLAHDVFLAVFDAAKRYQEQKRFRSWLYGIAVRKARHWYRVHRLRMRFKYDIWTQKKHFTTPIKETPETAVDISQRILQALLKLPDKFREVLILHAVEGYQGEEIAELLCIKPKTVWTRLHRARRILDDMMKPVNTLQEERES